MGALLVLGGEGAGEGEVTPEAPAQVLQIVAKELWTSAGERRTDALVVIADGRIRSIGKASEADLGQPLVRHEGVVTAGLIACRAELGAGADLQDDTRSVLAEARAADAIDPSRRDLRRALAAGITTVGVSPGPRNLVGGLACAVETAHGRVVAPETSLAICLSAEALGLSTARGGFLFGAAGETNARPSGGPEASDRTARGTREPTSYPGALDLLARLLAQGEGVFGRARTGALPVTIEAWDRHEVLRAAEFARAHGLKGAIRGAPLAGDPILVEALKTAGLGVIVGPYRTGQTRPSLASLAALSAAGVPVAFALDAPEEAVDTLRITAARALLGGATREMVWKALTEDAARLAGVGDSTGALSTGREADLVLWSGDPLDLASHVVAVYSDGERAWPDSTSSSTASGTH